MFRIGHYTGVVYPNTVNPKDIPECCSVIEVEVESFHHDQLTDLAKELKEKHCSRCQGGCPAFMKEQY